MVSDYEYTEQLLRRQMALRNELADICGVVDAPIPDDTERDTEADYAGPANVIEWAWPLVGAVFAVLVCAVIARWLAERGGL